MSNWPRSGIYRALRAPTGGLYNSPVNFSGWSGTDATTAANAFKSPDRKMNAFVVTEAATGPTGHYAAATASATIPAAQVKYTAYARRIAGVPNFMLQCFSSGFAHTAKVGISLTTGIITTAAAVTGSFTSPSAVVTPWRIGCFKVELLYTSVSDTAVILVVQGINGVLTESYVGDVGNSFAVWGIDFRAT